jgi:hypothetical protein
VTQSYGSTTMNMVMTARPPKVTKRFLCLFGLAYQSQVFLSGGYKASVVPGYAVTNIVYDLDATDPTVVDAITFDVAPTSGSAAAALVKVQTETGGSWTDCTLSGAGPSKAVTCTYGSLALEDVTALNVVASSTTDPAP